MIGFPPISIVQRVLARSAALHTCSTEPTSRARTSFLCTKRALSSRTSTLSADDEILFETRENAGIITLNRPRRLNALTASMLTRLSSMLSKWSTDDKVAMILLKAAQGKAFCSGGDLRIVLGLLQDKSLNAHDVFRVGYPIAYKIHSLPIPYCALVDGITIGGGYGLAGFGHYQVCTENTVLAIPELKSGFHADSGATYLLSRLKGKLGHYVALTASKLEGPDVYHAGFTTHATESQNLPALERELCDIQPGTGTDPLKKVLDRYTETTQFIKRPFSLEPHLEEIEDYFTASTVEETIEKLTCSKTQFASTCLNRMASLPPLSLKITKKALDEAENKSLPECLRTEYRVTLRMLESHDFREGVRATLLSKSGKPTWQPARLQDCSQAMVDSHFAPLPDGQELQTE